LGGDYLQEVAKFCAKRNPAKLPQKAVAAAVDEFIAAKRASGRSDRHLQNLNHRLGKFNAAFCGRKSTRRR